MLIATLPPLDSHGREIVSHPFVDALRFNTIMPIRRSKRETLERLVDLCRACGQKTLWIDLKARQLRITKWADPAYEYIELSHSIQVDVPTSILFKDHSAIIIAVEGNRLILEQRPRYALGAGQPVNIHDPSLVIHGFLTDSDREYIEAAKTLDIHTYMPSFVEQEQDIQDILSLDPRARIAAKIESLNGLRFVTDIYPRYREQIQLVAARDDLYLNIGQDKTAILEAEKLILKHDPRAIAASRILTSLETSEVVSLGDLKDLDSLVRHGFSSFMLSDALCLNPVSFRRAMAVYQEFLQYLHHQEKPD